MMKPHKSKYIKDPLHKNIEYSKFESYILSSKLLNRLHFITQNSTTYFTFPSTKTSRFIHSIGTMYVASHIFRNSFINSNETTLKEFLMDANRAILKIIKDESKELNIDDFSLLYDKSLYSFGLHLIEKPFINIYYILLQSIRVTALLHDLGHPPFSHLSEWSLEKIYNYLKKINFEREDIDNFLKSYEKITKNKELAFHEGVTLELLKTLFFEELIKDKSNEEIIQIRVIYKIVEKIMKKKRVFGFDFATLYSIIAGSVDADRIDYINRDSISSGFLNAPSEYYKIVDYFTLHKTKKGFEFLCDIKSLYLVEKFLEDRFNLYKNVFFHHKVAKTDSLLNDTLYFLAKRYFEEKSHKDELSYILPDNISGLWRVFDYKSGGKKRYINLNLFSQWDENWLINLLKKEYFKLLKQNINSREIQKRIYALEEVLFGVKHYNSLWKKPNQFFDILEINESDRKKFKSKFKLNMEKYFSYKRELEVKLTTIVKKFEKIDNSSIYYFYVFKVNFGIDKKFTFIDGTNSKILKLNSVSSIIKRLETFASDVVPFYLYSNKVTLPKEMISEIRELLFDVFKI